MIKKRLKGLLMLVLTGAAVLTMSTAVSAANPEAESYLTWEGFVFLKSDAIADGVYQQKSDSFFEFIAPDPAEIAEQAGVSNDFYEVNYYTMGLGLQLSGGTYNNVVYNDNLVEFPHNGFKSEEYLIEAPITNEKIDEIGSGDSSACKALVINNEAKEFTVDYYDIFGDKKGKFVFSDGKQELNGKDIFGDDSKNKKYILEYNDGDNSFSLKFNNSEYPSAWKLVTEEWSKDEHRGKTFDPAKLSLHREANFSLNDSSDDVNPEQIKYLKTRLKSTYLWEAQYNGGWLYFTGDQLCDFLENYNSNGHLVVCDSGHVYLSDTPLTAGETYDSEWISKHIKQKGISTLPYDLSKDFTIQKYYEFEWDLWSSWGNLSAGWIEPDAIVDSGRNDELTFADLEKVVSHPTIEYRIVPIVYSVNTEGGNTLDVTCEDKQFPAGGGEYLFIYGDSVRKVVTSGEELWAEIVKVADNYKSDLSKLVKISSITIAELDVEVPKIGGTPADAETNSVQYRVIDTRWTPVDDRFAAYTEYTVTAVLKPEMAFKFADDVTAVVNGEPADAVLDASGDLTVTYTFAEIDPWAVIRKMDLRTNPYIKVPAGCSVIPRDIFEKIRDSGMIVTIEYPDGTKWQIDGTTIDLVKIPADGIDISVTKIAKGNWATVVNNATGHNFRMQIDIAHSGDLGFTAYLVVDLSEGMTGIQSGTYYANLYQILQSSLGWSGSDIITKDADGKWTARLKFTHASDWLITIDNRRNPGKSSGSHSGGSYSRRDNNKIVPASTSKSSGWEEIAKEIDNADIGSTVKITLNDEPVITDAAAKAAASRRVKLVVDAGAGRTWSIDGANLTGSLNLGISSATTDIPIEAYKDITRKGSTQFNTSVGDFGFTAQISVPVGMENAGKNAALYRYNEAEKKLEFVTLTTVGNDGAVTAGITRGGKYYVAYGDNVKAPENVVGDLNGDGLVNALDASFILCRLVENKAIAVEIGDFNKDGVVNALDASAILRSVASGR